VSNKRTKAGRKKQLKQRSARSGGSVRQEHDPKVPPRKAEIDMGQSDYEEPEIQAQVESGGGMLLKMRGTMNKKESGDDASVLHKQRSLVEWAVWLVAAAAVVFFVIRYIKGSGA
jgi:hypothetical protein